MLVGLVPCSQKRREVSTFTICVVNIQIPGNQIYRRNSGKLVCPKHHVVFDRF